MALSTCSVTTSVIASLGTNPAERGLTTDEFKAKFDEAVTGLKGFINDTHIPEVEAWLAHGISRQAIINGNFDIWQRGTSFSTTGLYTADRWKLSHSASSCSVTKQTAIDEYGENALRMTLTTKGGSFADFAIVQSLESKNSYCFRGKKVTFSFLLRRNSTFNAGNIRANIYSGTGTDEPIVSTGRTNDYIDIPYSDISTTEWTKKSITATIANDKTQLGVVIRMGDTNIPDGSYIEIKQVQLCAGEVALSFQPKSFDEELRDCMRFFEKNFPYAIAPANGVSNYDSVVSVGQASGTSTIVPSTIYFKVKKRTVPTLTFYRTKQGSIDGRWQYLIGGSGWADFDANPTEYKDENGFKCDFVKSTAPFTNNNAYAIKGMWIADAEL